MNSDSDESEFDFHWTDYREDYEIACHNRCLCAAYDEECDTINCKQCGIYYYSECIQCNCDKYCKEDIDCDCYLLLKCSNYMDTVEEAYNTIDAALSRIKSLESSIATALTKETVCPPTLNPVEYPIAALFNGIVSKS
jgi:hypothetical protein